jgi:hypothetical protein
VADWVKAVGGAKLAERVERVAAIESHSSNRLRVAARSPMLTPRIIEPEPISERLIVEDHAEGRISTISRKSAVSVEPLAPELSRPGGSINAKWLAVVAAVSVALGAAAFALTRPSSQSVPSVAPVAGEPALENAGARVTPIAGALTPPAPPAEAAAASLSAPSIEITPVVASSKPAVVRRAPALAPKPSSAPLANKHAGCDPPFVIDAHGIRRIKAGCI